MDNRIEVVDEIVDEKIILKKVSLEDARFFFESLKEKSLTKYLSLGPLIDLDHSKKLINNYLKYWDSYLQYNFIIEIKNSNDNKPKKVGSISLWNVSWIHKRAEIGIWINSKYWNQGYGKRAINLIKNIGFFHLKLNRIEAHMAVDNNRSIKVFKACEFIDEGTLKQYLNFRGVFYDAKVFACLNPT
jgi:RimJ/RimL family protein N-acetyltransferase